MKAKLTPKRLISVLVLLLLMVFIATPALAFTSREGDQVVVAQGEVVEDDLYLGANTIHVYGTIKGDLIAFGSLVVIGETGVVEGDLLGAAQGVVVNGVVKDDVRVAAPATAPTARWRRPTPAGWAVSMRRSSPISPRSSPARSGWTISISST